MSSCAYVVGPFLGLQVNADLRLFMYMLPLMPSWEILYGGQLHEPPAHA